MDLWAILSTVTLKWSTLKGWMKMNGQSLWGKIFPIYFFLLVLRVMPYCVMGWTVSSKNIWSPLQSILHSLPSSTGKIFRESDKANETSLVSGWFHMSLFLLLYPYPSTYWSCLSSLGVSYHSPTAKVTDEEVACGFSNWDEKHGIITL